MSTDISPPASPYRAEVGRAKSRVGLVNRKAVNASEEVKADARRDLAAANVKAYIAQQLAKAPPLSIAQRESIISLLRGW